MLIHCTPTIADAVKDFFVDVYESFRDVFVEAVEDTAVDIFALIFTSSFIGLDIRILISTQRTKKLRRAIPTVLTAIFILAVSEVAVFAAIRDPDLFAIKDDDRTLNNIRKYNCYDENNNSFRQALSQSLLRRQQPDAGHTSSPSPLRTSSNDYFLPDLALSFGLIALSYLSLILYALSNAVHRRPKRGLSAKEKKNVLKDITMQQAL